MREVGVPRGWVLVRMDRVVGESLPSATRFRIEGYGCPEGAQGKVFVITRCVCSKNNLQLIDI